MTEHEHHTEPSARLDQLHREARDRREHERQVRWQKLAAEAEETLRRLNRGEPVEPKAGPAPVPEPEASRPLRDVPDDELDLDSVPGRIEAGRRGLWPARFRQPREDYEAQVAAYQAEVYREIVGRDRRPVRVACIARRVPVRSRGRREHRPGQRREHRPGQRKTASASRAGPGGGSDSDEPDPPGAAGSRDDASLACAGLSAADTPQASAARIVAACGCATPLRLRHDVGAFCPYVLGNERAAAVTAVYVRLPRLLRARHDRASYTGREGGRR